MQESRALPGKVSYFEFRVRQHSSCFLLHFNTKPRPLILEYHGNCINDPDARICLAMDNYLVLKALCSSWIE